MAEITTKTNAEPVWQTTERILSPLYEMANSISSSPSSATIVKVTEPVILTCGKKRRSDVSCSAVASQQDSVNCSAVVEGKLINKYYLFVKF